MEVAEILTSVALLFLALAVYYHLKIFSFWYVRGIRGPTPWPIFGTNIYYLFEKKLDLEMKWRNKYGKTYGLFEGYSPVLFVADAELIKEVYIKQFQSFMSHKIKYIHQENPKRWLVWSKGEYWANLRTLVTPMFTASKVRQSLPTMSVCVDRFMEQVDRENEKSQQLNGDKSMNKNDLSMLTLDVIASSFFGINLNPYNISGKQVEFIKAAYKYAEFESFRYLLWVLTPRQIAAYFKFDLFGPNKYKYFDDLTGKIVKERRKQQQQQSDQTSTMIKRNDVVQALIDAKFQDKNEDEKASKELDDKEAHYNSRIDSKSEVERIQNKDQRQKQLSDLEIKSLMTSFFIAGFETTATTVSFALYEIANQSEIQEKILNELREAFGFNGEKLFKNEDYENNYALLLDLKYLDAFLSEIMRIYAPVIDVSRVVTDENGKFLNINDKQVFLPYGTAIQTNAFVVQHDPDYFPEPEKFNIERFLLPENKEKIKTGTFIPFGIGPRYCVGMRFALLEIKIALAKLLLRYKVIPAKQCQYPPKFKQSIQILILENSDFNLIAR